MVSDDLINHQTSQFKTDAMTVEPILNEFQINTSPHCAKVHRKLYLLVSIAP